MVESVMIPQYVVCKRGLLVENWKCWQMRLF